MAHVHVNQRADTAVVVLLFVRRMSASPDSLCSWSSESLLQWLMVVVVVVVVLLLLRRRWHPLRVRRALRLSATAQAPVDVPRRLGAQS